MDSVGACIALEQGGTAAEFAVGVAVVEGTETIETRDSPVVGPAAEEAVALASFDVEDCTAGQVLGAP